MRNKVCWRDAARTRSTIESRAESMAVYGNGNHDGIKQAFVVVTT